MSVPTLTGALGSGGGRIEFVFHVGGFPYAISTSTQLVSALSSDTTNRRIMFGSANDGAGTPTYYSDSIPIFPCMDPPGRQRIKVDPTRGMDWGAMDVTLSLHDPNYTFSNLIGATATYGLPGIDNLYNLWADPQIAWGTLAASIGPSDTTIDVYDESGTLEDLVDNNLSAGRDTPIWIGAECIIATGTPASAVSGAIALSAIRGAYHTVPSSHSIDTYDASTDYVASAPLGGVVSRFGQLWAYVCNEDCSEISDPYLIQHGRIRDDVSISGGKATLRVDGWLSSIDTPPRPPARPLELCKYVVCRGSEVTDDTVVEDWHVGPHLLLHEYYSGSWHESYIWLCEQGGQATFDTLDDILDAIDAELSKCSPSASTSDKESQYSGDGTTNNDYVVTKYHWYVGKYGLECNASVPSEATYYCYFSGQLAYVLNLGRMNNPGIFGSNEKDFIYPPTAGGTLIPYFRSQVAGGTTLVPVHGLDETGSFKGMAARYHYSFRTTTAGLTTFSESMAYGGYSRFPVPVDDSGNERLWLKYSGDTSSIDVDYPVKIGRWKITESSDFKTSRVDFSDPDIFVWEGDNEVVPWDVCSFGSDGLGTSGDYKYIDVTIGSTGKGFTDADMGSTIPSIFTDAETSKRFPARSSLTWMPGKHLEDPWPIYQGYTSRLRTISSLIDGILGGEQDVFVPPSRRVDFIPYSVTSGDFVSTIDWDTLDDIWEPLSENEYYTFGPETEIESILGLLEAEIRIHGIQMYIELDETTTPKMNRIKFRKIGAISYSAAEQNGRKITPQNVSSGDVPMMTHSSEWRYSDLELKCNVGDGDGDTLKVDTNESLQAMGGRKETLKLHSGHLQIPDLQDENTRAEISRRLGLGMLRPLSVPRPRTTVRCTISAAATLSVGAECLMTHDGVRNPYTGAYGVENLPCLINEMKINWPKGVVTVSVIVAGDSATRGIAPAILLREGEATRITAGASGEIEIEPTTYASLFSHGTRRDISWFDCLTYNQSTGAYSTKAGCTCSDYSVKVVQDDSETTSPVSGTISSVDADANTATLNVDTTQIDWIEEPTEVDTASNSGIATGLYRHSGISGDGTLLLVGLDTMEAGDTAFTSRVSEMGSITPRVAQVGIGGYCYGVSASFARLHRVTASGYDYVSTPSICEACATDGASAIYACDHAGAGTTYRSTNGGTSWSTDHTGVQWDDGVPLGTSMYFNDSPDGLYERDSSGTWTQLDASGGRRIATDGTDVYYARGAGYVYKWDVSGGSGTSLGRPNGTSNIVAMLTCYRGDIYAVVNLDPELYRWVSGTTWSQVTNMATDFPSAVDANSGGVFNGELYWYDGDQADRQVYFFGGAKNQYPVAVLYGDWDDSNTQECQRAFACLADDDNVLTDSGSNVTFGHRIE